MGRPVKGNIKNLAILNKVRSKTSRTGQMSDMWAVELPHLCTQELRQRLGSGSQRRETLSVRQFFLYTTNHIISKLCGGAPTT